MGRKKGRSIPTLVHEGVELSTSRAKAELLSRVFALKATIDDRGREPPTLPKVIHHDLHRIDFENCEVHRLLEGLKARKATGPDGISARVLRDCANELTPSLSRLFRQSLSEGRVPSGWKHGRITACHKAGPKNNPENYRPISLLPIVSKVLETIVNRRLLRFLTEHKAIPDHQFGFRTGRSALDMAAHTTQRWSNSLDKGHEVRVVSLDLSRAFDRVWHRGLMEKLAACGIYGHLLEWLTSFLHGRSQSVAVNGQESIPTPVRAVVGVVVQFADDNTKRQHDHPNHTPDGHTAPAISDAGPDFQRGHR